MPVTMLKTSSRTPAMITVGSNTRPRRRPGVEAGRRGGPEAPDISKLTGGVPSGSRGPLWSSSGQPTEPSREFPPRRTVRRRVMQDRDMQAPKTNTRLTQVAVDIERHVAAGGWDQTPHLYALVETADLLRREPQLAGELGIVAAPPGDLTSIDQGDLPPHDSLDELLAGITWAPEVLGTALA